MTANTLNKMLSNLTDDETRCELSDYAVNTLRAFGVSMGYSRADLATMIGQERTRINAGGLDLTGYLRARRVGSKIRLSRAARRCVFAQVKCVEARSR